MIELPVVLVKMLKMAKTLFASVQCSVKSEIFVQKVAKNLFTQLLATQENQSNFYKS